VAVPQRVRFFVTGKAGKMEFVPMSTLNDSKPEKWSFLRSVQRDYGVIKAWGIAFHAPVLWKLNIVHANPA